MSAVVKSVRGRVDGVAVGLVVLATVWGPLGSKLLFPRLTGNNDEPVYLLQADALAHGRLFPAAPAHLPEAYTPWFAVVRHGDFILKYTPVHASLLALGRLVTGTPRSALGLISGSVVLLTYLLAREVLGDRRPARVAAAIVLCSPLFLVLSATYLAYADELAFLLLACWGLARERRTGRRRDLVVAGAGIGLAVFSRAYDGVLVGMPTVLWAGLAWWRSGGLRRVADRAVWFALGGLPFAVGFLAFNAAATGKATEPPFSLFDPLDTVGFGLRQIAPDTTIVHFGAWDGAFNVVQNVLQLGGWVVGGFVLFAAFVAGARRARGAGGGVGVGVGIHRPWLVGVTGLFLLGYVWFWGIMASRRFGLTRYLGPFYLLPLMIPLALCGAAGWFALRNDRRKVVALGTPVLALALTVVSLATALGAAHHGGLLRTRNGTPIDGVRAADEPALVLSSFVPSVTGHPVGRTRNRAEVGGPIVYAIQDPATDADVVADWPGRSLFLLHGFAEQRTTKAFDRKTGGVRLAGRTAIQPLQRFASAEGPITARLTVRNPTTLPVLRLGISNGPTIRWWIVPSTVEISLGADVASVAGIAPLPGADPYTRMPGGHRILLAVAPTPMSGYTIVDQLDIGVRATGTGTEAYLPLASVRSSEKATGPAPLAFAP